MVSYPRLISAAFSLLLLPGVARAETIYFQNSRSIEARSYEIKGPLIYITMTNGKRVYLRADSVDWEGTEKLKLGTHEIRKVPYSEADEAAAVDEEAISHLAKDGPLTAADLKRGGYGFARRKVQSNPRRTVVVAADLGWVDTRIDVRSGQIIEIRANGSATLAAGISVPPSGRAANAAGIESSLAHGALLLRVGLGGAAVLVGDATQVTAAANGRIYLCVNDKSPEDNSGGFDVSLKVPDAPPSGGVVNSLGDGGGIASPGTAGQSAAAPPQNRPPPSGMVGSIQRSRNTVAGAGGNN